VITFKYHKEASPFGYIKRPIADIIIETETAKIEALLYIDSGADLTMIPLGLGHALGFKQGPDDKILEIRGVSGGGVPYLIREASLIMNKKKLKIRLAWALIEEVPLLLGRLDIFDKFKIIFNESLNTISFISIKPL